MARPIVVVDKSRELAPSLAPGLSRIGVVLPYAPVHHLLFHAAAGSPKDRAWRDAPQDFALVATSANPSGEPLIIDDDEAREKLKGIADLVVGHDRAILARADDSVMTMIAGAPAFLRRARGFVPEPIELERRRSRHAGARRASEDDGDGDARKGSLRFHAYRRADGSRDDRVP